MAFTCVHCRSADVAFLFDSYECFSCGKHTTSQGEPILPDSLVFDPNHQEALAQFGWPFDNQAPTVARGRVVCSQQWGIPIEEVAT